MEKHERKYNLLFYGFAEEKRVGGGGGGGGGGEEYLIKWEMCL